MTTPLRRRDVRHVGWHAGSCQNHNGRGYIDERPTAWTELRNCGSDLRLQVSPDGLYTYPDIVVFCGEPQFADDRNDTITDATVIIEVLSPSTANYDRGFKFEQYRRVKSLKDYVVIAQDRVHVEHSTRQGDAWMLRETSDLNGVIELPSIECRFGVAEVYSRVKFP